MNSWGVNILSRYPFEVSSTRKGRGTFLCETNQGLKVLTEYSGSAVRAQFLSELLEQLYADGFLTDRIVPNAEGELLTVDRDGTVYMVKDWYNGAECDIKNMTQLEAAVDMLARLHLTMNTYHIEIPEFLVEQTKQIDLYEKHIRELKKIRSYVRQRRKKTEFEQLFSNSSQFYLDQATKAVDTLNKIEEEKKMAEAKAAESPFQYGIFHGDYNRHNLLMTDTGMAVTNFEQVGFGIQIADFANFLRKVMEKYGWNMAIGNRLIEIYNKRKPICASDWQQLYVHLLFPEKYWKVANHYYNSNKAWVSKRDIEKLSTVIEQEEMRKSFLSSFSDKSIV